MHLRQRTQGESFVSRSNPIHTQRLTQSFAPPEPASVRLPVAERPATAPATLDADAPTTRSSCAPANPLRSSRTFVRRITHAFGADFVLMLSSAYFGVKGILYNAIYLVMLPYYRHMGTPPTRYQALISVAGIPWSLKAAVGVISDTVPIFGYHKKYYMLGSSVVSLAAFVVLAAVPLSGEAGATLSGLLFFLGMVQPMVVDLLCEGKYAEILRRHPETGASIVSWVWFNYNLGSLVASTFVGPLTDAVDTSGRVVLAVCVPFSAQVIVPLLRGALPETRLPPAARGVLWQKLRDGWRPFTLAASMAAAALVLAILDLLASPTVILAYAVAASLILCALSFQLLPRQLAKCNLYMYLVFVLYIQVPSVINYWYTAPATCVPDGPHFDDTFFLTYSSLVGALFSMVGIWLFQTTMSEWRFRPVFWVNALLRIMAAMFDLVIIKRWNLAIGISDHVMYMLGDNIIYQVVYILDFMPAWILTSKLCPAGMEATVYALLAGFQNFGQSVSQSIGIFMIEWFDIHGTDTDCNYENLPMLVIVCHLLLPLITIPLTFWLIPDVRITDDLPEEGMPGGRSSSETIDVDSGSHGGASAVRRRSNSKSRDESLTADMLTPVERRLSADC